LLSPAEEAPIRLTPKRTTVSNPVDETMSAEGSLDDHATSLVTSWVVSPYNVAVAFNWLVSPILVSEALPLMTTFLMLMDGSVGV
jgi:hypothetical protein